MEGEITIIAKFTRKDEQPEGPVLPVCHATQVEGLDDANTAFMWQVGGAPPANHYHLARLTVKEVRFLIANPLATVDIVSDAVAEHQHTLRIGYDEFTGRYSVLKITSAGNVEHRATLIGIGDFENTSQTFVTQLFNALHDGSGFVNGEVVATDIEGYGLSRAGMELTDETYYYRCVQRLGSRYLTWVRLLKAPDTGGIAA